MSVAMGGTQIGAPRRAFLFGLGGAAALVACPQLLRSSLPLLWGDGEHDDTDGINALFSGRPIKLAATRDTFRPLFGQDGDGIVLKGGTYLLTKPATVTLSGTIITGASFVAAYGFRGDTIIAGTHSCQNVSIYDCGFDISRIPIRAADGVDHRIAIDFLRAKDPPPRLPLPPR